MQIDAATIEAFQRDGAVLIKGLFSGWIDQIAEGIEENMAAPGPYAAENLQSGESGRFFDDYCNWTRIPAFAEIVQRSPAASVAAQLMQSGSASSSTTTCWSRNRGRASPRHGTRTAPTTSSKGSRR